MLGCGSSTWVMCLLVDAVQVTLSSSDADDLLFFYKGHVFIAVDLQILGFLHEDSFDFVARFFSCRILQRRMFCNCRFWYITIGWPIGE
jgi:hypothetical protein